MSYAVAGYFVEKIGRRARSSFTWPPICADAFRRPEGFCNALKMMLRIAVYACCRAVAVLPFFIHMNKHTATLMMTTLALACAQAFADEPAFEQPKAADYVPSGSRCCR